MSEVTGGTTDRRHVWIGAHAAPLTDRQARLALMRGVMRLPQRARVEVIDVYCAKCRRPYEDVADQECSATIDNTHLRGGPIGERKKRTGGPTIGDLLAADPLPVTG